MCGLFGARCAGPGLPCKASSSLNGCDKVGADRCFNCSIAILTSLAALPLDATGQPDLNHPEITWGALITNLDGSAFGWHVDKKVGAGAAAAGLQLGDLIVSINGLPPSADWFDDLHKWDGKPFVFNCKVWRAGERQTVMLKFVRA